MGAEDATFELHLELAFGGISAVLLCIVATAVLTLLFVVWKKQKKRFWAYVDLLYYISNGCLAGLD